MRYVQMSEDLNEVYGLGLTQIAGIASFVEPATFRLKRLSESTVHVSTNTGISINEQWLGGQTHRVEALTLDNQWLDITAQCQGSSIPVQVVSEWSERNQRTLVDFRISA